MKVVISKNAQGRMAQRQEPDDYTPKTGEFVKPLDDFTIDEMPAKWVERRVWDDATNSPRLPLEGEAVENARTAKIKDFGARFAQVWDANYDHPGLGILLYTQFPNDPETIAVKAAKDNYVAKRNALRDLGRPGKPPLTQAEIDKIVW